MQNTHYWPNFTCGNSTLPASISQTLGGFNSQNNGFTMPDPGNTWTHLPVKPDDRHYELAKKILADPDFDIGKIILEMVARYLYWAETESVPEKMNDPVIQKHMFTE